MSAATLAPHGEGRPATGRPSTKPQATTPNDLRSVPGEESASPRRSQTDQLIEYADERFTCYRSHAGLVYGSLLTQPHRAYAHSPAGSPLMNEVKTAFMAETGKWAESKASAACADYLTTRASRERPREVAMRSTFDLPARRLRIDTGDPEWRVLEVTADQWRYRDSSPVSFRRSDLTEALPELGGVRGDLARLWSLVNVSERDRPLVLACLITAWLTGVPQPVVFVTGEQNTGKTALSANLR